MDSRLRHEVRDVAHFRIGDQVDLNRERWLVVGRYWRKSKRIIVYDIACEIQGKPYVTRIDQERLRWPGAATWAWPAHVTTKTILRGLGRDVDEELIS